MIIIVAPYSPVGSTSAAHLGAARKIEMIISVLSRTGSDIVLINSAHNGSGPAPQVVRQIMIASTLVTEITPPMSSSSKLGKLKNIFFANQVFASIEQLGSPKCIWFYNGYAFEMRLALLAWKKFHVPMILEFEDWHFSRSRRLNPKPYIDYFFWRRAAPLMDVVFAVNAFLGKKMDGFVSEVELLPGLVPRVLTLIAKESLPFAAQSGQISIGFFSGLSVEKGADIILKLVTMLPAGYVIHVTGSGLLEAEFKTYAKEYPTRLFYYGRVTDLKLYQLIRQCDVMLNPHSSIENMNNGIFPFKVIEAVASGRLLISTDVPALGLADVLLGVQFVEHSADAFQAAIVASRDYYTQHAALISQSAEVANQRFGEDSLLSKVQSIIN